jgi:hypothetical protein
MRNATRAARCCAVLAGVLLGVPVSSAFAQSSDDAWNPFKWGQEAPRKNQPAGIDVAPKAKSPAGRATFQAGPRGGPVESSDLPPVMAPDASGLPLDLWRGLDLPTLEKLIAALDLPPRSPALHKLWRRMLLSTATPPAGTKSPDDFLVLRQDALNRSGLLGDMAEMLDQIRPPTPLVQILRARVEIGRGAREAGCQAVKVLPPVSDLPGHFKGEAQVLAGYCAAVAGDAAAAGLAASMAREEGGASDFALAVLSSVESGAGQRVTPPDRISPIDYRLLEMVGAVDSVQIVQKAEPALLVALAGSAAAGAGLQTAAAETALRLNALAPEVVAEIYRRQPEPAAQGAPEKREQADALHRARVFRAIEAAHAPETKARLMRSLLEDARRGGAHLQTASMLAPLVSSLWPSSESGVLAETIVEIALAASDFELARRWAESAASLQYWLALIDIADPPRQAGRQQGLVHVDALAARGRIGAEALHRLATVLDALDINVPMGIWEAAGRAPQPAGGHLPETGVLAELAQVSQRKDAGHTALVVMRVLGSRTADEAHILALGDSVRALKRVGLEADARRLGVEALLAVWPRTSGH